MLVLKKHPIYIMALAFSMATGPLLAQNQQPRPPKKEGEIENQEITVEKSRKIELPQANRLFNKIPSLKPSEEHRKITYEFQDRPLTVADPKTTPNVLPPSVTQPDQQVPFNNYVKLGAGNYSSFLGEAFVASPNTSNLGWEGSFRHLSSNLGPKDGRNSGQSENRFRLAGNYALNALKFSAELGYNRDVYGFYGYRPRTEAPPRDSIRQRLNTLNFKLGFENTDNETAVDYSLKTGVTVLKDYYSASELDWGTNFNASMAITDQVYALLTADAYVTQRTDQLVDNRNLFRVTPTFKYASPLFTATVGVNAVNETDKRLGINRTQAFPVVSVDAVPTGNIHFFAGIDGDIMRNTLRSLLTENRWLAPNVLLANTIKSADFYGGSKGEIGGGFTYEGKVSYATYRNFYAFNNSWPDTSKFFVLYDGGTARVLTISGQLGYALKDKFRSTLKGEFYRYGLDRMAIAYHRPRTTATWTNSFILNRKLFITADLYMYEGIQAKNFVTNMTYQLPVIWDANLKIDYFLGKQFAAFVSLNNIAGQNYQRYLYYPVQGLNFLGGISYSF